VRVVGCENAGKALRGTGTSRDMLRLSVWRSGVNG
jgi:hypothetical protein